MLKKIYISFWKVLNFPKGIFSTPRVSADLHPLKHVAYPPAA